MTATLSWLLSLWGRLASANYHSLSLVTGSGSIGRIPVIMRARRDLPPLDRDTIA